MMTPEIMSSLVPSSPQKCNAMTTFLNTTRTWSVDYLGLEKQAEEHTLAQCSGPTSIVTSITSAPIRCSISNILRLRV
jgi:hypothetical protein